MSRRQTLLVMVEIPEHQRHRMEQAFIRSYRQEALGGPFMTDILRGLSFHEITEDVSDYEQFFVAWCVRYATTPQGSTNYRLIRLLGSSVNLEEESSVISSNSDKLYTSLVTKHGEKGLVGFICLAKAHIALARHKSEQNITRMINHINIGYNSPFTSLQSADRESIKLIDPHSKPLFMIYRDLKFWGMTETQCVAADGSSLEDIGRVIDLTCYCQFIFDYLQDVVAGQAELPSVSRSKSARS